MTQLGSRPPLTMCPPPGPWPVPPPQNALGKNALVSSTHAALGRRSPGPAGPAQADMDHCWAAVPPRRRTAGSCGAEDSIPAQCLARGQGPRVTPAGLQALSEAPEAEQQQEVPGGKVKSGKGGGPLSAQKTQATLRAVHRRQRHRSPRPWPASRQCSMSVGRCQP